MIGVYEARKLIIDHCLTTKIEEISLAKAYGFVLAEPVYSPIDAPSFDQSAMDGYAFSFDHWDKESKLFVPGEVQAGNYFAAHIKPNQAIRIFTGAPLPRGADTVVMQEKITAAENYIIIQDEQLIRGSNVRPCGSQIKKGEMALPETHFLSPASASFLAGLGIEKVSVYANPCISIIVSGKELVKPGQEIHKGKVYESNSYGLEAALAQLNIVPVSVEVVDDDEMQIINAISKQLTSDIILLTGGVSVGDYDFVTSALEKCGVKKIFHKVKQKPGKPLYFGKHQHTLVFGLPGNPASALICFYEYVTEAIRCFTKRECYRKVLLPLSNDYSKKPGLTYFLKGKMSSSEVTILNNQESYMMNSFALADCIIELEEEKVYFPKGEPVKVLMLI